MPVVTRSTGCGKRIAAANPIPCCQPKKVTFAQHIKQTASAEGRAIIHDKLDRPNPLLHMQWEFENGLARLKDLQRLEKEQKTLLRELFKKMEGRDLQGYLKDEVINLVEDSPAPESPLTNHQSPVPPGLGPL